MKRMVMTLCVVLTCAFVDAQTQDVERYRQKRLDKLIASLSNPTPRVRDIATQQIIAMGKAAAPRLLKELRGHDNYVRTQVVVILNRMGVKAAVPQYLEMLEDAIKRQRVIKQATAEYIGKRNALRQAERRRKVPIRQSDRELVATLKGKIPACYGRPEFEVKELSTGITQMGDQSHIAPLTKVLLDSRSENTVYAGQWTPAWRPGWETLEKLVAKANDPEVLRRCVKTLGREAEPIARKRTRTTAEANFLAGYQVLDLLVDARIDVLLYQKKK